MSTEQNATNEDTVRVRDLVQQAREVRTQRRQEYNDRVTACADAFLESLHVDFNQLIQDATTNGRTYASFFNFHLGYPIPDKSYPIPLKKSCAQRGSSGFGTETVTGGGAGVQRGCRRAQQAGWAARCVVAAS